MPDHLHVLFALDAKTTLFECLRLFEGRLAPSLRRHHIRWEDGYHGHRLRSDEDRLPVFLYIFLNPYPADLRGPRSRGPPIFACPKIGRGSAP